MIKAIFFILTCIKKHYGRLLESDLNINYFIIIIIIIQQNNNKNNNKNMCVNIQQKI